MSTPIETILKNFVINKLTTAQYNELKANQQLNRMELYMITDDEPDLTLKEDKSNKVTSLSSSSTDIQYPSAKCVYDLVGDLETLLGGI